MDGRSIRNNAEMTLNLVDDVGQDDRHLHLLKGEFPNVEDECLLEIFEHFENDFQSSRDFLTELFCEYFSMNDADNKHRDASQTSTQLCSTSSGNSNEDSAAIYLPITTELFDNLHSMFNTSNNQTRFHDARTIREDLNIQHTIYLPLNLDLSYEIYCNLMSYVQDVYGHLSSNNESIFVANDPQDNEDVLDKPSLAMKEIMATQAAINDSRKEYLNDLILKRKHCLATGQRDDALIQEWILEKKRDFLIKHFPGVDLLKLNRLFDLNFFNLSETIKDIEAFYDCKLPSYYNKSLYSEMVKKPPTNTANKTSPNKNTKNTAKTSNNSNESDQADERQFRENIQQMLLQRNMLFIKLEHLKRKKVRFIMNGHHNVVHVYHNEIKRAFNDLRSLSDDLIDAYHNYDFPCNRMDLHGLVMEEVRIIVPTVLRFKYQNMNDNKINFKIITGAGSIGPNNGCNSAIKKYVQSYLTKKKFIYRADGPGAFVVSLHASNQHISF